MRSIWRTHQIAAEALGDRRGLGREREGLGLAPGLPALPVDGDGHGEEHEEVDEPGLVEVVEADQGLDDADGDAGEERPRERRHAGDAPRRPAPGPACSGPRLSRFCAEPAAPARSESDSVARPPAMAHTRVDTTFGLMPARRARSGLSADALTALPMAVRLRSHPRPRASRGTTRRMVSGGPVIRISAISRTGADRDREPGARGVDLRERRQDRQRELGDADGGHEHDHPGRGEQPSDDDQLDDRPVGDPEGEAD